MTEDQRKGVWTTESLRIHVQHETEALRRQLTEEIAALRNLMHAELRAERDLSNEVKGAMQQAVNKAEGAAEKRLDAMNEFRASLSDQNRTFMPRSETDAKLDSINRSLDTHKTTQEKALDVLEKKVDSVSDRLKNTDSKYGGMLTIGAGVVAVIAAISSITAVVIAFTRKL